MQLTHFIWEGKEPISVVDGRKRHLWLTCLCFWPDNLTDCSLTVADGWQLTDNIGSVSVFIAEDRGRNYMNGLGLGYGKWRPPKYTHCRTEIESHASTHNKNLYVHNINKQQLWVIFLGCTDFWGRPQKKWGRFLTFWGQTSSKGPDAHLFSYRTLYLLIYQASKTA